jgi:NAD(P)-dependent dehydrogenase (short-subunit alcohol dehydrogenase family)
VNLNGFKKNKLKTIVVTGAAGGIGYAVVKKIINDGLSDNILALDNDIDALNRLKKEFDNIKSLSLDVTKLDEYKNIEKVIDDNKLEVIGLVNSAGVQIAGESLNYSSDNWEKVLSINLSGTFYISQLIGRYMIENSYGSIVNITSVAEKFGWPGRAPYAATKAGVSSLTRTLAAEWGSEGVRVNAVCPGYIETQLMRESIESGRVNESELLKMIALERIGTPLDVANIIFFLLSEQSNYITGTTVDVDGGFSIRKIN